MEGSHLLIVLTGIDGSGKTTAARALADCARAGGREALVLSNHAGRRRMSLIGAKLGYSLPARVADVVETGIRVTNVLISHARAWAFSRACPDGLVVMDRHLYCQLALRQTRGMPRPRLVRRLLELLPNPDMVVHLDVDPELAHQRIMARGTDEESLADLVSLRDAYRLLPEYADFVKIDANGTPSEVLCRVVEAVAAEEGARRSDGATIMVPKARLARDELAANPPPPRH